VTALAAGAIALWRRLPKLTPPPQQQQKEARRRRAEGATLTEIDRSYNVSHTTISRLAA